MRNVVFQEVGMENYGPYIEQMVLEFVSNKLILITGPNGIGKTMCLDAIPFTLYGNTSKGAKGDDVVNNLVGKNCKTWIKFKVNDDKYIVTRYHKYVKLGNTVIINKNGTDIQKGQKEVLPEIERIICPMKTFMNTLMFGQKIKDFFTDLIDSDKKEIFRKILNLEMYVDYYKKADEKLKELLRQTEESKRKYYLESELASDAVNQIKLLEESQKKFYEEIQRRIKEVNESIETNKRLLEKWELDLQSFLDSDLDEKMKKINEQIGSITSSLSTIDEKYRSLTAELESSKNQKLAEVREKFSEYRTLIIKEANKTIDEFKEKEEKNKEDFNSKLKGFDFEISSNEAKISRWRGLNESFQERVNSINGVANSDTKTCPLCEREVDDLAYKYLNNKCEYYLEEIRKNEINIKDHTAEIKTIQSKITELKQICNHRSNEAKINIKQVETICLDHVATGEQRLASAVSSINKISIEKKQTLENTKKTEIEDLSRNQKHLMGELEATQERVQQKESIQKTIRSIETQITTSENEIKIKEKEKYDETQLNTYKRKLQTHLASLDELRDLIKSFEVREKVLSFWKSGFSPSGIPSMLIDESIPFMNRKVSEYLDLITNGRYTVSFDTLAETKAGEMRDKISVRVVDSYTKANSRIQLSGGQTRLIDICTILTLGDLQCSIQDVKFNILLFDEIFDALDDENVTFVSKVLQKLKIGKTICLISHTHQEQLEADEVLAFR